MVEGNQETHHATRVVHKPPEDAGSQETVERGPTAQGEHTPAESDHGTYHGAGFSGKRLGKPPPTQQLEPQTSAGRQAGAPQAAPPVMYCHSCQGQAEWLPNGQLWCSRCQTALEVEDRTKQAGAARSTPFWRNTSGSLSTTAWATTTSRASWSASSATGRSVGQQVLHNPKRAA